MINVTFAQVMSEVKCDLRLLDCLLPILYCLTAPNFHPTHNTRLIFKIQNGAVTKPKKLAQKCVYMFF